MSVDAHTVIIFTALIALGLADRKIFVLKTLITQLPGPAYDLFLQLEFPFICRRIISLSSVTKTEPSRSPGIFSAGSEIITFVIDV
jgi:hypothetical protein